MYLIKQVSEISGVSVRTLHHYDEIGLLSPKKQENGYRYYSDEELSQLQTILYYKYLGFSLKEIKSLMKQNEDDLLPHLKHQLNLMQKEKDRLLTLIDTLEKTIASTERKMTMTTEEKFKGFTFKDNEKYKQAATEKYGENVDLAKQLHQHMCTYAFDCSIDVFSSIGFGYAKNEEFRTNLDKYGKGVGQYACDAIQAYVAQERK